MNFKKTQKSYERDKIFISPPNTARGKVESAKNPEKKPNKLRKSTSTEDMIAKEQSNNFHSLDPRPIKKTKSKFFINNLKESKYKSAKLRPNGKDSGGKRKDWDRTVKIEKKDLKKRRAEPPKTQRTDKDFVYLNVLQKSYKTITPKKLSPKAPMKTSVKNDTPLSNCNKGTTIPDILYSDLFQDLPKNNNPNPSEAKRDNGSICLNKVILLEGHNTGLSDEIKEFSPKEVCISASSKKIENFPENSSDSNNSQKKLTPSNKKINENAENLKSEETVKKEEDPKITRHNKIIEAIQNDEKQNYSVTNNDESVNVNLDETQNNTMNESGEIKKKLPKSFVKEIFERRNKNKTGTITIVEELNNMYVNKITNNIMTVPRSNSRGEKYLRQEPEEDNEEKKMIKFLKNRSEMANMCKIKIGNYDEPKKDDSPKKTNQEFEKINSDSSKHQKVEKLEDFPRKESLKQEVAGEKKNSNVDEKKLLAFLDQELKF